MPLLNADLIDHDRTFIANQYESQINASFPVGTVHLPQPLEASPLPNSHRRNEQVHFGLGGQSVDRSASDFQNFISHRMSFSQISGLMATAEFMLRASDESGGAVKIDPANDCLPILMGADGEIVLLRDFVEEIDGIVDHDELQERLPSLSFVQIASGIEFLRRLSQFNIRGIDIDAVEARSIEASTEFRSVMTQALKDKEVARVLNADQPYR